MTVTTILTLPETTSHLRRLQRGLVLPATTGVRTFVTARDMFSDGFDSNFDEYGTNVPYQAMPKTSADLYEMTADGDFKSLLGSFNINPKRLFWRSQDQVLTLVENHPYHLHPQGWITLFPFIVREKSFVASVTQFRRKLGAYVRYFEDVGVWYAENRHRVVLPQLGV